MSVSMQVVDERGCGCTPHFALSKRWGAFVDIANLNLKRAYVAHITSVLALPLRACEDPEFLTRRTSRPPVRTARTEGRNQRKGESTQCRRDASQLVCRLHVLRKKDEHNLRDSRR
eukprot:6945908-Pyramimonas_sp.AAC.1